MKNSNDIGNRTRDLPTCSAVPQPTAPPRTPYIYIYVCVCVYIYIYIIGTIVKHFAPFTLQPKLAAEISG